jgi:uncharacterized protein (DUF2062 family)
MKKKNFSLARLARWLYLKLCRINDDPQKVALGFALGVFLGIMPGVGLLVAILLASLFRLNRASTIIGTLITNTWLSFVSFVLAIKTGAFVMGIDWQQIYRPIAKLIRHFSFHDLLSLSFLTIILPTVVGFLIVSLCAGALAYLIALLFTQRTRLWQKLRR